MLSDLAQPVAAQRVVTLEKNVHVGNETALQLQATLLDFQDPEAFVVNIELQLQCTEMHSRAGADAVIRDETLPSFGKGPPPAAPAMLGMAPLDTNLYTVSAVFLGHLLPNTIACTHASAQTFQGT